MLNFSNNELYGEIPIGTQLQTFNASSFEGNSNLCGEPLDRKCPEEEPEKPQLPTTDAVNVPNRYLYFFLLKLWFINSIMNTFNIENIFLC
ncbi:putative non-specific serine/threonine protein kinase [Medicago truncatula]|uniref:Putative non-specific serine/threonine protein kinase n=1 Tax=Medicago truncatula TaxID=3880 RepID=A0A396K742_MEDTR|nr:putative non-specific serine/threonine protein kinase [Medicago truncatula]